MRTTYEGAAPIEVESLITRPVESRDLWWTAYTKPGVMLHLLRTEVLGKARFDAAFRAPAGRAGC